MCVCARERTSDGVLFPRRVNGKAINARAQHSTSTWLESVFSQPLRKYTDVSVLSQPLSVENTFFSDDFRMEGEV